MAYRSVSTGAYKQPRQPGGVRETSAGRFGLAPR